VRKSVLTRTRLHQIGCRILTSHTTGRLHVAYAIGAAGTGAAAWNPLRPFLDTRIELRALRLPGRESRLTEPAARSVDDQVDDILAAILPLIHEDGTEYSVIGNCSGAIVAYELARRLESADILAPAHLVVIGQVAPSRVAMSARAAAVKLSAAEAKDWLINNGNLPGSVITPDVVDLFLPILEADIQAVNSYMPSPLPMLRCPTTVLWDEAANEPDREGVRAWHSAVQGSCSLLGVTGARQLLNDSPGRLAAVLGPVLLHA
jgi:medium-chain acyl-[acyl-carrier-protein] hydrolase